LKISDDAPFFFFVFARAFQPLRTAPKTLRPDFAFFMRLSAFFLSRPGCDSRSFSPSGLGHGMSGNFFFFNGGDESTFPSGRRIAEIAHSPLFREDSTLKVAFLESTVCLLFFAI